MVNGNIDNYSGQMYFIMHTTDVSVVQVCLEICGWYKILDYIQQSAWNYFEIIIMVALDVLFVSIIIVIYVGPCLFFTPTVCSYIDYQMCSDQCKSYVTICFTCPENRDLQIYEFSDMTIKMASYRNYNQSGRNIYNVIFLARLDIKKQTFTYRQIQYD